MTTILGKRKQPRREVPWVGTLLEKLSFSKLPTNGTVLRRLFFELEKTAGDGSSTLSAACAQVKNELIELWEYAGYGDILKHSPNIIKDIKALRTSHQDLTKVPAVRRQKQSFKMKEVAFLNSLEELFDITVKSLQSSKLITDEDRDFLQNQRRSGPEFHLYLLIEIQMILQFALTEKLSAYAN